MLDKLPSRIWSSFENAYTHIVQTLSPYAAFIFQDSPDETKAAKLKEMEEIGSKLLGQMQNQAEQIEQISKTTSTQAGKTGIAAEAGHFQNEVKKHADNARFWLIAALVVSVVLFGIAGYFYCTPPQSITNGQTGFAWNDFVPRFSIFGLLLFFDIILIGNYKAERHNVVVNQHRANALNTFETMTASTITQDVKDAVTLTAAGAIYAAQETGFGKRGGSQQTNIAEILSAIVETRKD